MNFALERLEGDITDTLSSPRMKVHIVDGRAESDERMLHLGFKAATGGVSYDSAITAGVIP